MKIIPTDDSASMNSNISWFPPKETNLTIKYNIYDIKIKIPYLDRVDIIRVKSTKVRYKLPEYTIKEGKTKQCPLNIVKHGNISIGCADGLRDAKRLIKEDVIYSEWIDEIPTH